MLLKNHTPFFLMIFLCQLVMGFTKPNSLYTMTLKSRIALYKKLTTGKTSFYLEKFAAKISAVNFGDTDKYELLTST